MTFVEAVDSAIHDLHSFLLLRHGCVVAEGWWSPHAREHPHMLFSLSKSFIATAIGLCAAEGRLSLDDFVVDLLPDDLPASGVGDILATLRVRHLLTMSTGHDPNTVIFGGPDGNWTTGFLEQPLIHAPGTHFSYENGATYALSAIVQQVTGMTARDYLHPRLFHPLGIESATWASCPRGLSIGFTGLSLTTEEVARFGQLYLQDGIWQGKRILPDGWAAEATRSHISSDVPDSEEGEDGRQGYGYQFWRCRNNAYNGNGAFGQYCVVMPEHDAVLVTTGGKEGMDSILELFWQHAFPGISAKQTLSEDEPACRALRERLAGLSLPLPQGALHSPLSELVSKRTYTFGEMEKGLCFDFGAGPFEMLPESLSFDFSGSQGSGCICTVRDDRNTHFFSCGSGAWRQSETTFLSEDGSTPRLVAASGAWKAQDTYELRLHFLKTAFRTTLTCRFVGDTVTIRWHENASFGYPWHEEANFGYRGDAELQARAFRS